MKPSNFNIDFPKVSMKRIPISCLIYLAASLGSCQVGPKYNPPVVETPDSWKHERSEASTPREECGRWWKVFNDETLNEYENKALANNHYLDEILSRVVQARAIAGMVKSNLYPQVAMDPYYSNEGILSRLFNNPNSTTTPPSSPLLREHMRTNALPFNASYEVDLVGYFLSQYQAAAYNAQAEADMFRAAVLILTADVADGYFKIRTYDALIDLYLATIATRKTAVQINQDRFESKLIDYSAVSRAALDLYNVEAAYYDTVRLRDLQEDSLAVLLGEVPSEFNMAHNPLSGEPPIIPSGIPSEVLLQRPDIAQAERKMASENASVKAAYAYFFPSLNLTGTLGFSSPDLTHFLSWASRLWAFGASSVQTIFDGGYKMSNLHLSWALYEEADAAYRQQVLVAFQEVEDSLSNIEMYRKEYTTLALSVDAASTTYQIAKDRYLQGVTFYLDVTDSERDLLDAQRNLRSVHGLRYAATVQLIRSLGGTWSPNVVVTEPL